MARAPLLLLLAALFASGSSGCGASMHAVYEGDVRFEHCMALDIETHVKPSIRRACWAEWVAFYTYGQTRDRVLHAHLRVKQLSNVSDSLAPPRHRTAKQSSAPSPAITSTLAAATSPLAKTNQLGAARRCSTSCDGEQPICNAACDAKPCRDHCAAAHRDCLRRCM